MIQLPNLAQLGLIDAYAPLPVSDAPRALQEHIAERFRVGAPMGFRAVAVAGEGLRVDGSQSLCTASRAFAMLAEGLRETAPPARGWLVLPDLPPTRDRAVVTVAVRQAIARGAIGVACAHSSGPDDAERRLDDLSALASAVADASPVHPVPLAIAIASNADGAITASDVTAVATRHPGLRVLARGSVESWRDLLDAVREVPNVRVDLAGAGLVRGAMDAGLEAVGHERLVWTSSDDLAAALTRWRALPHTGVGQDALENIGWRNALRLFPTGALGELTDQVR